MHELPVVQSILDIVIRNAEKEKARKVLSVDLAIGELHDLIPEWVRKYFVFASRGTPAEGAELRIERIPLILRCGACGEHFTVSVYEESAVTCPCCGSKEASIVMGQELEIRSIEVDVTPAAEHALRVWPLRESKADSVKKMQ